MKSFWLIVTVIFLTIVIFPSCYQPTEKIDEPIITNEHGNIQGKVIDKNGIGLPGVMIECGDVTTVSIYDGTFILDDVVISERNLVDFRKQGFASNQKYVILNDSATIYLEAALFPVDLSKQVNAQTAFDIRTNGVIVDFSSGSLVDELGNPFSGEATVNMTYFDPTDENFFDAFPGEFEGLGLDGVTYPIVSFGFIDVEIFNGSEKLQLAEGKPATITMPIPVELLNNAPETIPLWHYDTDKGQWIEFGEAQKVGYSYVGEVTHFSKVNCDMKYDELSTVNGIVTDSYGNPIPYAYVKLECLNFIGGGIGYSDENGEFGFYNVKANEEIELIACSYGVFSEPLLLTTASNGGSIDSCNLRIEIDSNKVSGWRQINAPAGQRVEDYQFFDENNIWMLTSKGGMFLTTDGGLNWTRNFEANDSGTEIVITAFQFLDNDLGWMVGNNAVYKTINAGNDWTEVELTYGISHKYHEDVFFLNQDIGWITGSETWKTTDGGVNWQLLDVEFVSKEQIFFFNENLGFATSFDSVFKTTNSGQDWKALEINGNKINNIRLSIVDESNVWILTYRLSLHEQRLFFTSDLGETIIEKDFEPITRMNGIHFVNPTIGWIVGSVGIIYHTSDAGNTWETQYNTNNRDLQHVYFKDEQVGWAMGTGFTIPTLLYTNNGGVVN